MTKREAARRGSAQVQIGSRRAAAPILGIVFGLALATDVVHFHILHKMLGTGGVAVCWLVFIGLVLLWGKSKLRRR